MKKKKQPIKVELTNPFRENFISSFKDELETIIYLSSDLMKTVGELNKTNKFLKIICSISLGTTLLLMLLLLLKL